MAFGSVEREKTHPHHCGWASLCPPAPKQNRKVEEGWTLFHSSGWNIHLLLVPWALKLVRPQSWDVHQEQPMFSVLGPQIRIYTISSPVLRPLHSWNYLTAFPGCPANGWQIVRFLGLSKHTEANPHLFSDKCVQIYRYPILFFFAGRTLTNPAPSNV